MMPSRRELPPRRLFRWAMKTLQSAVTKFDITPDNVYHLHITHDIIKGITPAMLCWWFQNIGGEMEYHGKWYPKYLVWHPYDHVFWGLVKTAPDGSIGIGARFRIVEAFGRNTKHYVDSVEDVVKLDETGIRLSVKKFGIEIFSLEHQFIPHGNDSTRYISDMRVGASGFFGKYFFNPLIRPFIFTKAMGHAWLQHNIEEVGNFEYFLADLYHHEAKNIP